MKLVTKTLEEMTSLNIFPIISMVLFLLFFGLLVWWIAKADNEKLQKNSRLPLDEEL